MKPLLISLVLMLSGSLQAFAQSGLLDLKSLDDLQKQFTSDAGKVRLIALLSPT